MTVDDAYRLVLDTCPRLLYLTGKTCTGKTTFSSRINAACAYETIELDEVVMDAIVKPFGLESSVGEVFVSVYKTADNAEWNNLFAKESQRRIQDLLNQDKKVVVDGAVANPEVIRRIFNGLPKAIYIYFHPAPSSAGYLRNITTRFTGTSEQHRNGLPNAFWACIDDDAFKRYCQDRIITPQIGQGIANYAQRSSKESVRRLESLRATIPDINVVDV